VSVKFIIWIKACGGSDEDLTPMEAQLAYKAREQTCKARQPLIRGQSTSARW